MSGENTNLAVPEPTGTPEPPANPVEGSVAGVAPTEEDRATSSRQASSRAASRQQSRRQSLARSRPASTKPSSEEEDAGKSGHLTPQMVLRGAFDSRQEYMDRRRSGGSTQGPRQVWIDRSREPSSDSEHGRPGEDLKVNGQPEGQMYYRNQAGVQGQENGSVMDPRGFQNPQVSTQHGLSQMYGQPAPSSYYDPRVQPQQPGAHYQTPQYYQGQPMMHGQQPMVMQPPYNGQPQYVHPQYMQQVPPQTQPTYTPQPHQLQQQQQQQQQPMSTMHPMTGQYAQDYWNQYYQYWSQWYAQWMQNQKNPQAMEALKGTPWGEILAHQLEQAAKQGEAGSSEDEGESKRPKRGASAGRSRSRGRSTALARRPQSAFGGTRRSRRKVTKPERPQTAKDKKQGKMVKKLFSHGPKDHRSSWITQSWREIPAWGGGGGVRELLRKQWEREQKKKRFRASQMYETPSEFSEETMLRLSEPIRKRGKLKLSAHLEKMKYATQDEQRNCTFAPTPGIRPNNFDDSSNFHERREQYVKDYFEVRKKEPVLKKEVFTHTPTITEHRSHTNIDKPFFERMMDDIKFRREGKNQKKKAATFSFAPQITDFDNMKMYPRAMRDNLRRSTEKTFYQRMDADMRTRARNKKRNEKLAYTFKSKVGSRSKKKRRSKSRVRRRRRRRT